MPINIPASVNVVKTRVRASIQSAIQLSNPFLKGSWLGALADSFAERVYDFYITVEQAIDEVFPDTTSTNIDRWGSFYGISKNPAIGSSGHVVVYINGTPDPVYTGQVFVDQSGNEYEVTNDTEFTSGYELASSLTRSSSTATFNTVDDHNLKTGDEIVVSGATQTDYNGTFIITVVDNNTFTYTVANSPATPATGAPKFAKISMAVPVKSVGFGADLNLAAYTAITLQAPVVGIDDDGFVNHAGLTGAQDAETDDEFRARVLDIIRNPIAHFNASEITSIAKTVTGITRVFVQEATPAAGQVTIYLMSDDDPTLVPSSAKITETKNKILTIKPANTSDSDVIVQAPTKDVTNFDFSALSPNTSTMRASIEENLKLFFKESLSIGEDIIEDAYRAAIYSTVDTSNGATVSSFSLTSPTGDVSVADGHIAVLGTVTFS